MLQVSRRSEALHDRAYLNFQYSMATFSTSERKKRSRGDRYITVGVASYVFVLCSPVMSQEVI